AMPPALPDDLVNVVGRESFRAEVPAAAAVDLQIEEGRCYPVRLQVGGAGGALRFRRGDGTNEPVFAADIDPPAGRVVAGADPAGRRVGGQRSFLLVRIVVGGRSFIAFAGQGDEAAQERGQRPGDGADAEEEEVPPRQSRNPGGYVGGGRCLRPGY